MEHVHHAHHLHHARQPSLNRTAWSATLHCLAGCAIGEVLGMVIGTALGWGNVATIALAVALAFLFGFALTLLPLVKATGFNTAAKLALASDTASITVMEVVDNAIMLVIPGAMDAGSGHTALLGQPRFRTRRRRYRGVPDQSLADRPRQGPRGGPCLSRPPLIPEKGRHHDQVDLWCRRRGRRSCGSDRTKAAGPKFLAAPANPIPRDCL